VGINKGVSRPITRKSNLGGNGIGFSPICDSVRTLTSNVGPRQKDAKNVGFQPSHCTPSKKQQSGQTAQYVERPLSFDVDRKNAFIALLQYAPSNKYDMNVQGNRIQNEFEQKTTSLLNRKSTTTNTMNTFNVSNNDNIQFAEQWQSNSPLCNMQYEVNMTPSNNQYAIYLNDQYVPIIGLILSQNIPTPLYLRSTFTTTLNPEEVNLSSGARRIMLEENAGGQSELSEGFSFEFLRKIFGAKLVKTEMAIRYWWNAWKKTDYSVKMNGEVIGVSVTRAMKYKGIFDRYDAEKLLRKKLFGINESSLGVLEQDEWQRQILHIWATDEYIERILYEVFLKLLFTEPDLVRNTIIMVTVTSSWWIFYQDKYIKAKEKNLKKKVIREEMNKMEALPLAAAVT